MRYLFLTILLACLTTVTVDGQVTKPDKLEGGSVYSFFGVGAPVDYRASYANGMGMKGVAVYDPYAGSLANPAFWGRNVYSQATGGVSLQSITARDQASKAVNSQLSVNLFQGIFPIDKNKLAISVSLYPVTKMNFSTFDSRFLPPSQNNSNDTLRYGVQNRSEGGLNKLELGVGWKIAKFLSVGYAGSYVFGPMENKLEVIYGSNNYENVNLNRRTTNQGFGNRFGVLLMPRSVLKPGDQLNIGATVNLPVQMSSKRKITSDKSVANQVKTVEVQSTDYFGKGNIRLPMGATAGINYKPTSLFSLGGEVLYQQWSNYRNYYNQKTAFAVNRYKYAIGARFRPYRGEYDEMFSKFKYNAGISYDTGHLILNGKRIQTLKFSLGLGILSPNTRSSVDLNFHYGFRGTNNNSLVKENIWGFRLSANLAELMFFRPKLR